MQEAAFVIAEKVPAVQLVQTAFEVVVHTEVCDIPGAHVVHVEHGA